MLCFSIVFVASPARKVSSQERAGEEGRLPKMSPKFADMLSSYFRLFCAVTWFFQGLASDEEHAGLGIRDAKLGLCEKQMTSAVSGNSGSQRQLGDHAKTRKKSIMRKEMLDKKCSV